MHRHYLEPAAHVTNDQPYALYHWAYQQNEMPVALHWHPEAELFYLQEGEMTFCVENQEFRLGAGEGIFIPPQLLHIGYNRDGKAGCLRALVFSADLVAPPSDAERTRRYVLPVLHGGMQCILHLRREEPAHRAILQDLVRVFHEAEIHAGSDLVVEGLILVMWQEIFRALPALQDGGRQSDRRTALVQEAMAWIHRHYAEDVSLEMIAGALHVSGSRLCRVFRQMTGSTLFASLNRFRIMKSCELLQSTDKKISEISSLCGFNNISYFNREFLRITRTTPSNYRRGGKA